MSILCQREKTGHTTHTHKMCVHKSVYLCYCERVVYIYAPMTGAGVEMSISDAQFMGFLLLASVFADWVQ